MINNTDKAYQDLLKRILNEGKLRGDRTGTGTISIFSHTLEMDMADGFPLLTTKKMFTKGIIHELLWFLNGDTNIQYLVKNGVNIWTPDAYREYKKEMERGKHGAYLSMDEFKDNIINDDNFAKKYGELGPVYGHQWVKWGAPQKKVEWLFEGGTGIPRGINQIQQVIDKLNNKPEDRRIMVSAWNVAEIDEMALPPCHYGFELYTEELSDEEIYLLCREAVNNSEGGSRELRDEDYETYNIPTRRLSLKWHQRSVDTFLGLPFNIASYGFLLHMFAQQTNMVAGTLIGDLTNVHIYKNHVEQCEEQISREPMELPKLSLGKADNIFSYCYENVKIEDYLSHPSIKGEISV